MAEPVTALAVPEDLIARAIDKGVDVATMERLLAMRAQLRAEAAREAYYSALSAFQKECPAVVKSKVVNDKYGKFRYRYAPLEEILKQVGPLLSAHGFSYTLDTEQANGQLTAICRTHHIGGHSESTKISVPVSGDFMSAQQLVGSARTYACRYAFCGGFGIMTADEDDDGRGSENHPEGADHRPESRTQAPSSAPATGTAKPRTAPSGSPSAGSRVFGFGKFRGKSISDVPLNDLRGYGHWLREQAQKPDAKPWIGEWAGYIQEFLAQAQPDYRPSASEAPPEDDLNLQADAAAKGAQLHVPF